MRQTVTVFAIGLALALAGCAKNDCGCSCVDCSFGDLVVSGSTNKPPAVTALADNGSLAIDYVVDFGAVALGAESAGSLTFDNTGNAPLQILSVGEPTDPEF